MGKAKEKPTNVKQLILGFLFGIVFGFLLQKGGVAKYHILLGVLLLEDFTVIKVMLSAIIVGMLGIFTLHGLGLVELHIKPTRYAANIFGGLLFGVGFALIGYCPGTGTAASRARKLRCDSRNSWTSGRLLPVCGSIRHIDSHCRELGATRETNNTASTWRFDDEGRACTRPNVDSRLGGD